MKNKINEMRVTDSEAPSSGIPVGIDSEGIVFMEYSISGGFRFTSYDTFSKSQVMEMEQENLEYDLEMYYDNWGVDWRREFVPFYDNLVSDWENENGDGEDMPFYWIPEHYHKRIAYNAVRHMVREGNGRYEGYVTVLDKRLSSEKFLFEYMGSSDSYDFKNTILKNNQVRFIESLMIQHKSIHKKYNPDNDYNVLVPKNTFLKHIEKSFDKFERQYDTRKMFELCFKLYQKRYQNPELFKRFLRKRVYKFKESIMQKNQLKQIIREELDFLRQRDDSFGTINEAGLSRLLRRVDGNDFIVATAFRGGNSRKVNKNLNKQLFQDLASKRMSGYKLTGHWQEAPDGMDWQDASEDELTDIIEDSVLFVKPSSMSREDFVEYGVVVAKKYNQDAIIVGLDGEGVFLYYKNGSRDKIGNKLTLGKTAQAYSQMKNKPNIPFVFEGVYTPSTNFGRMAFKKNNIAYDVHPLKENYDRYFKK